MNEYILDKIVAFFEDNKEIFTCCIEELDAYNGCLGEDRIYNMEEIDELYADETPTTLLFRAFYGHDSDTWTTDASGNKTYGEFNPNRMYFYFNGYGNFVSSDSKDYTDFLDRSVVEEMNEYRQYIDSIEDNEELSALFDALKADE